MSIGKLFKETAAYGLSSILGRVLYFLLVPLYIRIFDPGEYGVVTDLFSFIGLMLIFFTYRFETAYFRFQTDYSSERMEVYRTALGSVVMTSLVIAFLIAVFHQPIASLFRYPEYDYIIVLCGGILATDAISEIPLSRLRLESRVMRFAMIRLSNIMVNIGLNLFFLVLCPWLASQGVLSSVIDLVYKPEIGIGYIFISNLVASILQLGLLSPYWILDLGIPDWKIWKNMAAYSFPLVIVGISFSINELLDRKIMIWLLPGSVEENKIALGMYGACYKLTMIMALFTQAFRYGAEPFFFRHKNRQNAPSIYADVTKYYGIVAIGGCLFTLLYIHFIKRILTTAYWDALPVVPILLLANLANGLYYNVSVWYRLKDKTMTGAWIALLGAAITIGLNLLLLPRIGIFGAALATLTCYIVMLFLCYFLGQKLYPIPYNIPNFVFYVFVGSLLYLPSWYIGIKYPEDMWVQGIVNTLLFSTFVGIVLKTEKISIGMLLNMIHFRKK